MKMLGRSRYIVQCCKDDDTDGMRRNKKRARRAQRHRENAEWKRNA